MLTRESFEQMAAVIVDRIGQLLRTWVCVVNERAVVIEASAPFSSGLPLALGERPDYLRIPLQLERHTGEVIVQLPEDNRVIAPHLARELVELIVHQLVMAALLPDRHELKNKFIHDLLCGPARDEPTILREAQILGMDLGRPRTVLLIDAAKYILTAQQPRQPERAQEQIRQRAERVIASIVSFFQLPSDTICAYIGQGEVAVLKASSSQDLLGWTSSFEGELPHTAWADLAALKRAGQALLLRLRSDTATSVSISVGRYHPRLEGLACSYNDARAALSLGRRFHGHNRVHCLDSLGIAAFIGIIDESMKIDLARHLLSPLDREPELLETLRGFFQTNCSPSEAASSLSIHRNTLSYRLEKIASFTGLDPRHFDDAVQIRLALLLRTLPSEATALSTDYPRRLADASAS
ncbi:PucR family transcriptional regulator [Gloeobacter kilaueensis]|uniref:Carbohydrate diacid transcriptional activator CdaR n=1 Tax=Gloeobacter kilaueensis (strain ATCC BAA-2537 / CCAP 1431/1 / ULC 316 / JS1) TaxID=1183438 RepID=U5QE37_GLOK1|nr:helix-turn-helix domain-containing protein [Gloeobacter kilaueensis]AGY57186.1 carbohydrate diacid transcriptional activator CdaR [Gloeobacter kilaueensis JS1]